LTKKLIILALGLTCSLQLVAQVERQAIENILKGKWEKAFYQLDRASNKDTIHATTAYAWAIYFGDKDNPDHSLDSASRYIRSSVVLYGQASEKQRDRLRRFPLDSLILIEERDWIDSCAYAVARSIGSADAYQRFVDVHPGSVLQNEAIAARDERAYQDAVDVNTHQAFHDCLGRYPQSNRVADATANYERLLYQVYTSGQDLAGYERFLREHPGTSFEREAQRNVFEIQTADGGKDCFTRYVNSKRPYHRQAANILFHLYDGASRDHFPAAAWTDSLKSAAVDPPYVAAFLGQGKFGFMDPNGREVLNVKVNALADDYLCGNVTDDFIRLDSSVMALNGTVIYAGAIDEVEDIGLGLLLVGNGSCQHLIYKSGRKVVSACLDQAKVVANRFIAIQRQGKWQLLTLTGRLLMKRAWDGITSVNQIIVLEADGQKYASTPGMLAAFAAAPGSGDPFTGVDKVSRWSSGITWIHRSGEEILLDATSDTVVHTRGATVLPARFGVVIKGDTTSHTVNWKHESSEAFGAILVSEMRAIVQTSAGWRMFDPVRRSYSSPVFDSLWWTGSFAIGTRGDSASILYPGGQLQKMKGKLLATAIQGPDSTSFLLVDVGAAKPRRLYARNGKLLFAVPYEKIEAIGRGYFRITKGGKFGLLAPDGKVVVPPTMDAIGALSGETMSLLRDGRFGLFHCITRKVMQPQYPTNIVPYGKRYFVAQKSGLNGFFTWDGKPVSKFEYEEVKYWNDTAAFVRKDTRWSLISLARNTVVVDQIRGFNFIRDKAGEKLAIVHAGDSFGVMHNRMGIVIPLTFTDIVNIGSAEWPLYFTEKHIAEAAMFVVIYYDRDGKFLRKEVYSPEDYERIYCPNN
jgi:hypothetical protein